MLLTIVLFIALALSLVGISAWIGYDATGRYAYLWAVYVAIMGLGFCTGVMLAIATGKLT